MTRHREPAAVRWGVPLLLLASCAGAAAVSMRAADVPTLALGSHIVFSLQLALIFFYGSLLLLVPVVRALLDGDLPIELSLRGARWEESLRGFEMELFARQADLIEAELRGDYDFKNDMDELRDEVRKAQEAQEEILDGALRRVAAIEEKVMSPTTPKLGSKP